MGNDATNTGTDEQIKKLQQQVEELDDKWKRALADYQNLEKRIKSQQANYIRLASMGLIDKLLPVVDDLERAAAHVQDGGLKMILKQLSDILESEGVTRIEASNKTFDPEVMDCVEMVEGKKNTVVSVIQPGYRLHDTVIRPAKVEVGNGNNSKNHKKDNKERRTQ